MNVLAVVLGSILILYSCILFFLLFYALNASLKTYTGFSLDPVGITKNFQISNYVDAFRGIRQAVKIGGKDYYIYLPEMFWNSILYAVGCAFFATLAPCLVAYATARFKFRFNSVIYGIVIFAMVTPIVGNLPSQVEMTKKLGLYDSMFGMYFLSFTFLGTYYLIFHATFKSLSQEYADAAAVDGASQFTTMVRIMFPLVKSTFFVIFLMLFISYWNEYQTPMLFMPNQPVAAVGVQFFSFTAEPQYRSVPIQLAGSMLLLIPILVLFTLFRNKLSGNLTVGVIKG
ncbi:MAG: carbohydrate ABC transporter permease [Clostridia bacterium]|nr:carbohydrate ABC transporter permease [Clostridia bacterium]